MNKIDYYKLKKDALKELYALQTVGEAVEGLIDYIKQIQENEIESSYVIDSDLLSYGVFD